MIYIRSSDIAQDKILDGKDVAQMDVDVISATYKMRILNIFKKWISDQEHDFEQDDTLCRVLASFLDATVSGDAKIAPYARKMMEQITEIAQRSHGKGLKDNLSLLMTLPENAESTDKLAKPTVYSQEETDVIDGEALPTAKSPRVFKYRKSIDVDTSGGFGPAPPADPCPPGLSRKGSIVLNASKSEDPDTPKSMIISTDVEDVSTKSNNVLNSESLLPTPVSATMKDKDSENPTPNLSYRNSAASILDSPTQRDSSLAKTGAIVGLRSILYPDEKIIKSSNEPGSDMPTILELDGELLGQQLGLIEQKLFKGIPLHEFFCQGWNDKVNQKSPSLQKLISWFNNVAIGCASEVVRQKDIKTRVLVLKKLITSAQTCLTYSNYNTCFEIVAGLNMAAISRLKLTWKALPKKYLDTWVYLNQIVSNASSYRAYRMTMKETKERFGEVPVLPYVGVNLSDLTFSEDGNPSFFVDPVSHKSMGDPPLPLVNFGKMRLISAVFSLIKEQQRSPNFEYEVSAESIQITLFRSAIRSRSGFSTFGQLGQRRMYMHLV
jgi:hypothetical protein